MKYVLEVTRPEVADQKTLGGNDMTKKLIFKEMAERALEQIAGDRYAELISKAKHAATYSNSITDDKENWDKNAQWLVADMADVVKAYFIDYAIEEVFGTNPAEGEGPEEWFRRHSIKVLG